MTRPEPANEPTERRFGAFSGVFTPSILTILGVVMYLRFGWVVGHSGLLGALAIVGVSHLITLTTGLSIATIATNRTVGAGGAYNIISRSLGAPSGAAIGLPLFFGQALSVSFYVVGFTESLEPLVPGLPFREFATAVCLVIALASLKSAGLVLRSQHVIMVAIGLSLVSFFAGRGDSPPATVELGKPEDTEAFTKAFSVFFPAVTGIMAGVGMSGDLKDPRRALPRGTMAAIFTGLAVYLAFPVWLSLNADSQTLRDTPLVVWEIARFPSLIYVGVWGATLSSALGSILTAPRTLQALAMDGLVPRILGRGAGPHAEPRIATVATLGLALGGIWLGNLNAIADTLTMFFLATYGFTNLACGLERWAASPSFRPDFRTPWWISIAGAGACFYVMSIINLPAMLLALVVCGGIFGYTQRRVLGTTYGDARHGIWAALVRTSLHQLRRAHFHPQSWRPNLIVMGGDVDRRPYMAELGSAIVQDRGIVTLFHLVPGDVEEASETRQRLLAENDERVAEAHPNVFYRVDVVDDVMSGITTAAQSYGVGSFEANTVMLGFARKPDRYEAYARMLRSLVALDRSLLLIHHRDERGFGRYERIHVWWGGLKGNGGLMLLLVFLLTADHRWRRARVELMTVVSTREEKTIAEQAIRNVITGARVAATPRVILREGRPIPEIMRVESHDADLAIIGIRLPGRDEAPEAFFERVGEILDELPTTLLVYSARNFPGEPVLFQD